MAGIREQRRKIYKLLNTVKYMSGRQWIYRIRNTVLKQIPRKATVARNRGFREVPYLYESGKVNDASLMIADRVMKNEFPTISDIFLSFENRLIDWDLKNNDYRLVCFRLNSFKYLLQLSDAYKVTYERKYIDKGFSLIEDWQSRCGRIIMGDKWNAYVIAERLMNWIGFYSVYHSFCYEPDQYIGWIASQTLELRNSIEYQMGANHLLSEARALMYAGAFLKNKKIYEFGKQVLVDEFKKQFLDDGGNYERSISYHVEALQQYFEATILMHDINDLEAMPFHTMLIRPYIFLNSMVGADGHIPLINDSAYDYPFSACDFLNTTNILYGLKAPKAVEGDYSGRWKRDESLFIKINWSSDPFYPDTGFLMEHYEVGDRGYSLFFDAGDIGADENPGHAHADSLNVLWSEEEKVIFSDSGVFTYKPGSGRDKCRGTASHNTIEIDGKDSAEVWAAFRVAKRGKTTVKAYSNNADRLDITASHDGYCKVLKQPVLHTRRVRLNKKSGEIRIDDLLDGKGKHRAALRFHLSPDCKVELVGNKTALIDNKYLFECSCEIGLEDCQIAEYFGKPRYSKCIKADFLIDGEMRISSILKIKGKEEN